MPESTSTESILLEGLRGETGQILTYINAA